jgi:hypothetical protein
MRILHDDLWLCEDCMLAAVNGDMPPDASPERDATILAGLDALGPHLASDFASESDGDGRREFARTDCACCHSGLAGSFFRFAILTP